jgi:hypothetical protein
MNIYILPVHERLQPNSSLIIYPEHNDDYWLEQDFWKYLQANQRLITQDPQKADFHYLPVFWSRLNNNHSNDPNKREELQKWVNQSISDDLKTFTICQPSGTLLDVGRTIVFCASRRVKTYIDLPLICKPHQLPIQSPTKKYLASFVGKLGTHAIRAEMAECFKGMENVTVIDGNRGEDFYVEKILESYITLCPRGAGGSSYRFFETMQLGGVPFMIGDLDTRPFKKYINWDEYSFFAESPQQALKMVKSCQIERLLNMGRKCSEFWKERLTYGKWCGFVLEELNELKR